MAGSETSPAADQADAPELLAAAMAGLSSKERKRLRERARRQVEAEEAERIRAARADAAPKAASSEASSATPSPSSATPDRDRTDADRAADAAEFLSGFVFPVLSLLAMFSPWRLDLDKFTADQAKEDGRAWVPLARRYAFVDSLITWASIPGRLMRRLRAMAVPRAQEGDA